MSLLGRITPADRTCSRLSMHILLIVHDSFLYTNDDAGELMSAQSVEILAYPKKNGSGTVVFLFDVP